MIDKPLTDAINDTIREYQQINGASLGETILSLTLLKTYYTNEAIKHMTEREQ